VETILHRLLSFIVSKWIQTTWHPNTIIYSVLPKFVWIYCPSLFPHFFDVICRLLLILRRYVVYPTMNGGVWAVGVSKYPGDITLTAVTSDSHAHTFSKTTTIASMLPILASLDR